MQSNEAEQAAQQRATAAEARRRRILERGQDRFSQIAATYNAPAPPAGPRALAGNAGIPQAPAPPSPSPAVPLPPAIIPSVPIAPSSQRPTAVPAAPVPTAHTKPAPEQEAQTSLPELDSTSNHPAGTMQLAARQHDSTRGVLAPQGTDDHTVPALGIGNAADLQPDLGSGSLAPPLAVSLQLQRGVVAWQRALRQTEALRVAAAVFVALLHCSPTLTGWLPALSPLLVLWATQLCLAGIPALVLLATSSLQRHSTLRSSDPGLPQLGVLNLVPGVKPIAQVLSCVGALLVGLADGAALFLVMAMCVQAWQDRVATMHTMPS